MSEKQRESMASSQDQSRQRESMAESEEGNEEDDVQKRDGGADETGRVKKLEYVKQYNFVDDNSFYPRRISYKEVDTYWRWLVSRHYRPQLPQGFISWLEQSRNVDYTIEVKFYPLSAVVFMRVSTHYYWDFAYLWLCALFLILLGLQTDGFLDDIFVIDAALVGMPLLLMVITQVVPVAGAVAGVVYMNDLTKFLAVAQIHRWAIGAVLVAQYVEFAYYGGHGRLDRASKIRMSETRSNTMKYSVKDPLQPTMSEKLGNALSFLLRLGRPARVADEEGSEVEEEEAAIAYYLNEDGKMVYIDDNGNEVELSAEEVQMLTDADKEEASLAGSLEGSQVSGVGSQVSYQSRAASRISEGSNSKANSKDLEMMEVGESGKRKKLTAAEKLRRRKEKLRLAQEAEKKLVEEDEGEQFDDGVELGKGGGFLQRREAEMKAAKEEMIRQKLEKKRKEEEGCTDWWEWECVICKNFNRRPSELQPNYDTTFVTKGVFFKHTVIALRPTSTVPTCERCYTAADYEPRLCNKHLITDIPEPYAAFQNYPVSVPRLPRHWLLRAYDLVMSFFFGRRNHPDSKLMTNDWRMSIYLSSMFPEIKRHTKKPEEFYQIGEIVECKLQKSDWCRARITDAKSSRAYDIKYDSGDVVRLVDEKVIRLPPSKGWYAYRVELTLVGIIMGTPLGLYLSISAQDPGLVFLPMLVGCGFLLALRLLSFGQGLKEYITAGCIVLSVQASIFILPLLFFVIASLLGLNATSLGLSWVVVSIVMFIALILSLPYLYMKRVTFAFRLLPLIILFLIGSLNASLRLDGAPVDMFACATVAPGVIMLWQMMRFRADLGAIWDVSLIIRPIGDAKFKPLWIMKQLSLFIEKVKNRNSMAAEEEDEDELGMKGAEEAAIEPTPLTSIKSIKT